MRRCHNFFGTTLCHTLHVPTVVRHNDMSDLALDHNVLHQDVACPAWLLFCVGAAGMFLRVFCQIAAALQEQGVAARAPGGVWNQAVSNFNGEQLAYIAAFATGAQLLFGDRPKHITYR